MATSLSWTETFQGILCPGFFWSAYYFAHSGGQSVIHRRNALSVGLTPPPGTVGFYLFDLLMLPN